jgi:hypothetical protein
MTTKELDETLHDLVAIQNTFRSYEQLANECFRFRPKEHFHKCVLKIQAVIDHGRQLTKGE